MPYLKHGVTLPKSLNPLTAMIASQHAYCNELIRMIFVLVDINSDMLVELGVGIMDMGKECQSELWKTGNKLGVLIRNAITWINIRSSKVFVLFSSYFSVYVLNYSQIYLPLPTPQKRTHLTGVNLHQLSLQCQIPTQTVQLQGTPVHL